MDQFAYRYTRLQDDMGTKLMSAVLKALGEDVAPMSALDRFVRLEQLGWLVRADSWQTLIRAQALATLFLLLGIHHLTGDGLSLVLKFLGFTLYRAKFSFYQNQSSILKAREED